MKAPSHETSMNDDGRILRKWTTSKGNRVALEFQRGNRGNYDISFVVNNSTTEDITRSSDREILQTVLYQIKKTIDENGIDKFSFDAWNDSFDDKSISKMINPYASELALYIKKYKSDYSIGLQLERILQYFPYMNELSYVEQALRRINHLLNYPDLDSKFEQFLQKMKLLMQRLLEIIESGESSSQSSPNRRLAIYKRFLSQYLGPEWSIEPKGRNGIYAIKSH